MSESAGYLDSHLHLQGKTLAPRVDALLERAGNAGVRRMFCNATHEDDWQAVIDLAAGGREIIPFLGIHPWFAETAGPEWETRLLSLVREIPAGIGEIGLDRRCRADFRRQQQVFLTQLHLASELGRPVVIHCVKAWGPLLESLEQFAARNRLPPTMIHSYAGSKETLRRLLKAGCLISFSCRLMTEPKLLPCFLETPLPRLLLETDSQGRLSVAGARAGAGATDSQGRLSVAGARDGAGATDSQGRLSVGGQVRQGAATAADNPQPSCAEPATILRLYAWAASTRGINQQELRQRIWSNGEIFTDTILPR
jgi:TatD DNase family protein